MADLDEAPASTQHAKSLSGTPVRSTVGKVPCAGRVVDFEAIPEFCGGILMQVDFEDGDVSRGISTTRRYSEGPRPNFRGAYPALAPGDPWSCPSCPKLQ